MNAAIGLISGAIAGLALYSLLTRPKKHHRVQIWEWMDGRWDYVGHTQMAPEIMKHDANFRIVALDFIGVGPAEPSGPEVMAVCADLNIVRQWEAYSQ